MLWAEDTLSPVQDINRNPVKVRSFPGAFLLLLVTVFNTFIATYRAFALNTLKWSGMDKDMFLTMYLPICTYFHCIHFGFSMCMRLKSSTFFSIVMGRAIADDPPLSVSSQTTD